MTRPLYPRERVPVTLCSGVWVCLRDGMEGYGEKEIYFKLGFELRTAHFVGNLHTYNSISVCFKILRNRI